MLRGISPSIQTSYHSPAIMRRSPWSTFSPTAALTDENCSLSMTNVSSNWGGPKGRGKGRAAFVIRLVLRTEHDIRLGCKDTHHIPYYQPQHLPEDNYRLEHLSTCHSGNKFCLVLRNPALFMASTTTINCEMFCKTTSGIFSLRRV